MSKFFDVIDNAWISQRQEGKVAPDQFLMFALNSVGIASVSDVPKFGSLKTLARKFCEDNNQPTEIGDIYDRITLWQAKTEGILKGQYAEFAPNSVDEMFEIFETEQTSPTDYFGENLASDWKQRCRFPAPLRDGVNAIGYNEQGALGSYPINFNLQFDPTEVEQCMMFANRQDIVVFLKATKNREVQCKLNKLLLYSNNDNACIVGFLSDFIAKKTIKFTVNGEPMQATLGNFLSALGDWSKLPAAQAEVIARILENISKLTNLATTKSLKDPTTGLPVSLILV